MSLKHSPSVVTNGLVFYYDMNNTQKSFRGKPTTNFFTNGHFSNGAGITQESGSNSINTVIYFPFNPGNSEYVLEQSGGPYTEYQINLTSELLSSTTYVMSGWYGESTDYTSADGSRMFHSRAFSSSGAHVALGTGIGTVVETRVINGITWKYCFDIITTPSDYNNSFNWYLGFGGNTYTGKRYYTNVQMEQGSYPNRFVNGTRYTNNNLETVSTPTWNQSASSASGGTLTFTSGSYNTKGTWDLYKTYSGLSTATNYTWSASVKKGTATNLIVTMNNTQAWDTGPANTFSEFSSTEWKRVSITGTTTSGSFNIHLGSSFNTGFSDTIQTGGTILIQDVRLQLTSSQTAIQDLVDQNTIAATSLTYASDGTFSFNYDTPNYITVPLASALNKTEGTMNFWVYPTRYSGGNGYFVNREDATANAVDWFWIGPYSDTFYFRLGNGSDCCSNDLSFGSVSTVIPINTWTNMCFTWKSNGTSAIYKNGNLVTSRSLGNVPNTNPASNGRIGLGHANGPSYFDGKMPIVQIYNREFTAGEVLQNFNALRGRYGI